MRFEDYEVQYTDEHEEEHNLAIFSPSEDPSSFEEATKNRNWRRAMELQLEAIERNKHGS